jgi:hypothetical protein
MGCGTCSGAASNGGVNLFFFFFFSLFLILDLSASHEARLVRRSDHAIPTEIEVLSLCNHSSIFLADMT